jgi:adenosylcobinamide-phosphate synthase
MTVDPRDGAARAGWHDDRVLPPRDLPTAAGLALGAAADLLLADPPRWHPVAGFGRAAAALERRLWRDSRTAGAVHAALLTGAATCWGVVRA